MSHTFFNTFSRKYLTIGFGILVFIACTLVFYTEPVGVEILMSLMHPTELKNEEQSIINRLGHLHNQEQQMSMDFRNLQREMNTFMAFINEKLIDLSNISSSAKSRKVFTNIIQNSSISQFSLKDQLKIPSVYDFLPHLLSKPDSLKPALQLSKNRSGVSMVLGIPTVQRRSQSYLIDTLTNLISNMGSDHQDALIVILIAEVDKNNIVAITNEIKSVFQKELDSGFIDIISPSPSYYPDFDKLELTLLDDRNRVKWRSKQCLDFAFLMMYAYQKGVFYVQLEDDIMAKELFLTTMKEIAVSKIAKNEPWLVLDFCQLGFIGKMFRCSDLPKLINFIFTFFNDKPVDWLLDNYIQTKVCNLEKDDKDCKKQKDRMWVHIKPSLFQHIGKTSSLEGKTQNLKDKQFGKVPLFVAHNNPKAVAETTIKTYQKYSLQDAYNGENYFWGLFPKKDDYIDFQFIEPIDIEKFKFKTGSIESPSDKLLNASVYVKPISNVSNFMKSEESGLIKIGIFDNLGIATGIVKSDIGQVSKLKIIVNSDSNNWVIISEILKYIEEIQQTSQLWFKSF